MLSTLAFLIAAQYPGAEPFPKEWESVLTGIQVGEARQMATYLAGPDFMGRDTGSEGHFKAAQWAADWMKRHGIAPGAPDGSYFQEFFLERSIVDPATTVKFGERELRFGSDIVFQASAEANLTAPTTFVRVAPKGSIPANLGGKLAGRVVILLAPDGVPQRQAALSAFAQLPEAERPLAVLSAVVAPLTQPTLGATRARGVTVAGASAISSGQITTSAAMAIALAAGAMGFNGSGETTSVEATDLRASMWIRLRASGTTRTVNVIGKIVGAQAGLKEEAVVIGAHLDHLGVSRGQVHWGADDNASGSTAALLAGRALAQNRTKLGRTVIIGLWSAEERGLWGSKAYVAKPSVPISKTVAYVNMDMVGRDANHAPLRDRAPDHWNAITLGSAKLTSPELHERMVKAAASTGLVLRMDKEDRTMRSDTGSFAAVKVPVAKLWSGEHQDYHKPTDTPEKLNGSKIATVARWVALCAADLSKGPRPAFVSNSRLLRGRLELTGYPEVTPNCTLTAELLENGVVLDRTVQPRPGVTPFLFGLVYVPTNTKPDAKYAVRVRIVRPKSAEDPAMLISTEMALERASDGSFANPTLKASPPNG